MNNSRRAGGSNAFRSLSFFLVLAGGLGGAISAHAATVVVTASTNIVDGDTDSISLLTDLDGPGPGPGLDGKISIHEAVTACNLTPGADTILFDASLANGFITSTSVVIPITESLTIDGEDKNVTLDCDGASGTAIFILTNGSASSTIRNFTIMNAFAGGIRIEGTSTGNTIQNMVLVNNGASGIAIDNSGTSGGNVILGCKIGTDGASVMGNTGNGILIFDSSDNTVGGTGAGEGNVISANAGAGILVSNSGSTRSASNNKIVNNIIGMSADGHTGIGNGTYGIYVLGLGGIPNVNNTVIGDSTQTNGGNLVSGNMSANVYLSGTAVTGTVIQRNIIGADIEGDTAVFADASPGIEIAGGASSALVGGEDSTQRNIISGNNGTGILIIDCSSNTIKGNYIGTAADGFTNLGNGSDGIQISASGTGSSSNLIGGTELGANIIAYNGGSGVLLQRSTANVDQTTITYNSIHSNTGNGITFAIGTENAPVTAPSIAGIDNTLPYSVSVVGAGVGDTLHLYADSAEEGRKFIGSMVVTVAGGPTVVPVNLAPLDGKNITATSTDPSGNTSRFSAVAFPNPVGAIPPSLRLERNTDQPDVTNVLPVYFDLFVDEPITGLDASDIVNDGDATNLNYTITPSGGNTHFTIQVTSLTGEGLIDPRIPIRSVADSQANQNTADSFQETTAGTVYFDSIPPNLTVDSLLTNNTSPGLTGTIDDTDASISVVVDGGSPITALNNADGTWSLAQGLLPSLSDGTYEVLATGNDSLNSQVDSTTLELTVDTTPPTAGMNTLITNDPSPALSGPNGDSTATVLVSVGTSTGLSAVNNGSTWDLADNQISDLVQGHYDVVLDLADPAGNTNQITLSGALIVDLTDPILTVDTTITSDTTPELTGTVTDATSTSVEITVNSQAFTAGVTGGVWTVTLPNPLPDGEYTVDATAVDAAGNTGTASAANGLIIDTAAPTATVTSLTTSDTSPALSGTVDDGSPARTASVSVSVTVNGTTYPASTDGIGGWTIAQGTIAPALADGAYDVSVAATDSVGNTGGDVTSNELTIDTTAPTVTVDTLASSNPLPVITGTVSDLTGTTINVVVNGEVISAVVDSGVWSAAVTQALGDGVYDVSVTALDAVGLSASDSTTDELLIDTVAPVVSVDLLVTSNVTPTITGTVDETNLAHLTVTVNGITYNANVSGSAWFADISAGLTPDTQFDVDTLATDTAGNTGTDSTSSELHIDTSLPVVTIDNLTTSSRTPHLTGTLSDLSPTTVSVTVNGSTYIAVVAGDLWSVDLNAFEFDGIYEVTATATDSAENIGTDSTSNELTVDTTAPVLAVNSLTTNDTTPVLSGTVTDLTAVSVELRINGVDYHPPVDGNTWAIEVTEPLPDGTYDVAATGVDAAGNTGTDSSLDEVTVAANAPSLSLNTLVTNNPSPTISGTASGDFPMASVEVIVHGQTYSAAVADSTWTAAITEALPEGAYDVTVSATDTNSVTAQETFTQALTIDTTAPVVTVDSLVANTSTPVISGTLDTAGSPTTLHVSVGGQIYTLTPAESPWSFTVVEPLSDGEYDVAVSAVDDAGNSGSDSTTNELTIETIAPSATSLLRSGASPTNGASVDFELTFSESIKGLEASDITVIVDGEPQGSGGAKGIGGLPLNYGISGGGNAYTISVETGSGDGTIGLRLENDGSITDTTGNPLVSGIDSEDAYVLDRTPPVIAITSKEESPTSVNPIPLTVTFSEFISEFSSDQVSVTNATISTIDGDGLEFDIALIPTADGEITVSVNADAIRDEAGNGNVDTTTFSITYAAAGEGEGEGEGEGCISGCSGDTSDGDGDGLSPCIEACIGTSDDTIDSDGDGMADNFEFKYGLNPRRFDSDVDTDGDDLSNLDEFLNNSDPTDAKVPNLTYFVAVDGSDETGTGALSSPWRTIGAAIGRGLPRTDRDARIVIGEGTYEEDITMRPRVILTAKTGANVTIIGHVTGAHKSALRGVTIVAAEGDTYLLDMNDVAMELTEVNFIGSEARDMTGILVDGLRPAGSLIDLCRFTSLGIGIDIGGAIPQIRRCTFADIPESFGDPAQPGAAIIIRASDNKDTGGAGKSIGDSTDPATGWNDFLRSVEGLAVINEREEEILMQSNYWGFTDPADFNQRVQGPAVLEPVLAQSSAVLAASIFCTVWSDTEQKRIGTAAIDLNISSFKSVTNNDDGVYAFPAIAEGQYSIVVNAPGFDEKAVDVDVAGGELKSVTIALSSQLPGEGEGEGEGEGCLRPANAGKALAKHASDLFLGGLTLLTMSIMSLRYRRRDE